MNTIENNRCLSMHVLISTYIQTCRSLVLCTIKFNLIYFYINFEIFCEGIFIILTMLSLYEILNLEKECVKIFSANS